VTAPSILVIDDGELDRVQALLGRMQVDWVRCLEPTSDAPLGKPHDLIISSGPRAMRMPPLSGDAQPLWLCLYDQDFLPLRERLRDLGVHYLVSGDLAPRTFELFLRQLLHRGAERRQVRRIPLHCELELYVGSERRKALLLELSRESCVFSAREPVPERRRVTLRLPAELTGDTEVDLTGSVLRATASAAKGSEHAITTVLRFDSLDADAMARIHHLLSGHALGTQVTPLHAEPGVASADPTTASWLLGAGHGYHDVQPELGERRKAHRHHYGRKVEAIRWEGPDRPHVALGQDLSLTGLSIVASPQPPLWSEMSLALYGREREEPLLVGARVVRLHGDEVGLRFVGLTPGQVRSLERLLADSPCVEDLSGASGSRHVIELTSR
jgi:hypothetical protein